METHLTSSKVQAQLVLCAAAAAGCVAAAPSADAAVVSTFANTVIAVPATTTGVYLNLQTGASGASAGAVTGWDFNPYLAGGGTQLGFYWAPIVGTNPRAGGVGTTATTGPYSNLSSGTTVGPASIFTSGILATTGSSYLTTGTEILGFRFTNAAGVTNYGYLTLQTTAATGFPATIRGWVYEDSGAALTVNAVPEPSTVAALALVGGAVGLRAWRRRKVA